MQEALPTVVIVVGFLIGFPLFWMAIVFLISRFSGWVPLARDFPAQHPPSGETFGWTSARDYWFPEIRSLGGAIAMLTLVLYPYVYLLARSAFLQQSVCVLEASRTLGRSPWHGFFTVALPLARPAIVAGVSLALMETLNDFGVVDFFAVQTFTACRTH